MLNMTEADNALAATAGGVNIQIQTVSGIYNECTRRKLLTLIQLNLSDTADGQRRHGPI